MFKWGFRLYAIAFCFVSLPRWVLTTGEENAIWRALMILFLMVFIGVEVLRRRTDRRGDGR